MTQKEFTEKVLERTKDWFTDEFLDCQLGELGRDSADKWFGGAINLLICLVDSEEEEVAMFLDWIEWRWEETQRKLKAKEAKEAREALQQPDQLLKP